MVHGDAFQAQRSYRDVTGLSQLGAPAPWSNLHHRALQESTQSRTNVTYTSLCVVEMEMEIKREGSDDHSFAVRAA